MPLQPVEPRTEAVVREQIASLLGDADAPDRWSGRSLQLTETEGQATGMEVCLHPVAAEPRSVLRVDRHQPLHRHP